MPDDVESCVIPSGGKDSIALPAVMVKAGLAKGTSEARRLIEQGGVKIDGEKVLDVDKKLLAVKGREFLIQAGKRAFKKVGFS